MKIRAINKGIDEELFNEIIEMNKSTLYHKLLNIEISMLDKGIAEITITIQEKHLNPAGNAHGGMLFSLFDTAMGMAVRTLGRYNITSLDMDMNFIAPARPGNTLTVTGRVVHLGRSTVVSEGEAYNQDGKLIAICKETFFNFGLVQ